MFFASPLFVLGSCLYFNFNPGILQKTTYFVACFWFMLRRCLSGEVKDAKMKLISFYFKKLLFVGMLDLDEIGS